MQESNSAKIDCNQERNLEPKTEKLESLFKTLTPFITSYYTEGIKV